MKSAVEKNHHQRKASLLQGAGVSRKAGSLKLGGRHPPVAASSSSNLSVMAPVTLARRGLPRLM